MQLAERLRAGRSVRLAAQRLVWLAERPRLVLGALLGVQWAAVLALALVVRHNSWLYYHGGDQTYYYTTGWLLSHWTLPQTPIGYGWSYLLSPIALLAGKNVLVGLPAIVVLNTLVLLPVALLSVYGIAARIGGRVLGYWAAALWIAIPYAAIPGFDHRYHQKYVELTLPQTLGFSALADFPSMVCLLVAAYLLLRTMDTHDPRDAVLAGLAAGFALALKPSNGIFLIAAFPALAAARRWRELVAFGALIVPALATLALWKERGLGQLPAFAQGSTVRAAGLGASLPAASILHPITKYVNLDWGNLHTNLEGLREFFWSLRAIEWVPFAGLIAIGLRAWPKAILVFGWFAAFFVLKGTSPHAKVEDASFFRLMMPSLPAFILLLAAVPMLVPGLPGALVRRFPVGAAGMPRFRIALAVAGLVFVVGPLIVVAATRRQSKAVAVSYPDQGVLVPVERGFAVGLTRRGRAVHLSWQAAYGGPIGTFYRVLRSPAVQPDPDSNGNPPVLQGVNCYAPQVRPGAALCRVLMKTLGTTVGSNWVDRPSPGRWSYRIGLSANWLNDPTLGDVLVLSDAATVTVRR